MTLAKYMEHALSSKIVGKTVVELGSGTGLVGIAASMLGAGEVHLTDLPYALKNTRANVDLNKPSLKGRVICEELDWCVPTRSCVSYVFMGKHVGYRCRFRVC